MEKYFQLMQPDSSIKAQRILELNTEHPAFTALENAVTADPEKAKIYAKLLYDQALLIAGLPLDDPSGYTDLVCGLMKYGSNAKPSPGGGLHHTPGPFCYFSLFRQFSAQKHLRVENPRGGVLSVFGVSQPHRAERDGIICFFLLMILDRNTQFFSSPVILNACRMVSVSPEYSR